MIEQAYLHMTHSFKYHPPESVTRRTCDVFKAAVIYVMRRSLFHLHALLTFIKL